MLPVDIDKFWADDALAHKDNCFYAGAPQVALGIRMSDECVFAELGEQGNPWGNIPRERRIALNKRYNDLSERIVGRRLLQEKFPEPDSNFPPYRKIGEVFGGEYIDNGTSVWLKPCCSTPKELETVLDRVDQLDLYDFLIPKNWVKEKKRIFEQYGKRPPVFNLVRGPVTLAASLFGIENLIFLLYDEPQLAARFRDTICRVILEYHQITVQEAGTDTAGFSFCDDDCCLLTPELYSFFGYPILEKVFEVTAPNPGDCRFQHSDSDMGHLLPILGKLNLTGCNFGPTVSVREIRKYMPNTRIDGQLSPLTFMRNNEAEIINEVKRDCEMAKESGVKGLNISTAGSINNGSLLTSMRAVMYAIQTYGKYE